MNPILFLFVVKTLLISATLWGDNNLLVLPGHEKENETLNLDEKEPISHDTFRELLNERIQEKIPLIIARVVTIQGNQEHIHYFDAHTLYQTLFSEDRPDRFTIQPSSFVSPLNRVPIEAPIELYRVDDGGIAYLGTEFDVQVNREEKAEGIRATFFSSVPGLTDEQRQAVRELASMLLSEDLGSHLSRIYLYLGESFLKNKDMAKAHYFLRFAYDHPDASKETKVAAAVKLGELYLAGVKPSNWAYVTGILEFVRRNDDSVYNISQLVRAYKKIADEDSQRKARQLMEQLVNRITDKADRATNLLDLAKYYEFGFGGEQNLAAAIALLEGVIAQEVSSTITNLAKFRLAIAFLKDPNQTDSTRAMALLKEVARQNDARAEKFYAMTELARMMTSQVAARKILDNAVAAGSAYAFAILGELLFAQRTLGELPRARQLLAQAARSEGIPLDGYLMALVRLGEMEVEGLGGPMDVSSAISRFKRVVNVNAKAKLKMRVIANFHLGKIYHFNVKDFNKAAEYYQRAIAEGMLVPEAYLARINMATMIYKGHLPQLKLSDAYNYVDEVLGNLPLLNLGLVGKYIIASILPKDYPKHRETITQFLEEIVAREDFSSNVTAKVMLAIRLFDLGESHYARVRNLLESAVLTPQNLLSDPGLDGYLLLGKMLGLGLGGNVDLPRALQFVTQVARQSHSLAARVKANDILVWLRALEAACSSASQKRKKEGEEEKTKKAKN